MFTAGEDLTVKVHQKIRSWLLLHLGDHSLGHANGA